MLGEKIGEAAALKFRRHLGVNESDTAELAFVLEVCRLAVSRDLETIRGEIVANDVAIPAPQPDAMQPVAFPPQAVLVAAQAGFDGRQRHGAHSAGCGIACVGRTLTTGRRPQAWRGLPRGATIVCWYRARRRGA